VTCRRPSRSSSTAPLLLHVRLEVHAARRKPGVVAAEGDDPDPEACVGSENAVITVAVDPGWGDQAGEGVEKLEGREGEEGAAVGGGAGRAIVHPTDVGEHGASRRGSGSGSVGFVGSGWLVPGSRLALDTQTVEGEGGPGAVADEPLAAGAV